MATVRVEGVQIFMEGLFDFVYGRDAGYYHTFSVQTGTDLSALHWLRQVHVYILQPYNLRYFISQKSVNFETIFSGGYVMFWQKYFFKTIDFRDATAYAYNINY